MHCLRFIKAYLFFLSVKLPCGPATSYLLLSLLHPRPSHHSEFLVFCCSVMPTAWTDVCPSPTAVIDLSSLDALVQPRPLSSAADLCPRAGPLIYMLFCYWPHSNDLKPELQWKQNADESRANDSLELAVPSQAQTGCKHSPNALLLHVHHCWLCCWLGCELWAPGCFNAFNLCLIS